MNLPHYSYFTDDFREYEFYSDGPNGRIKKRVTFTRVQEKPVVYNLALVDVISDSGAISDLTVSDNGDRDIILSTVAYTVRDFSTYHGNHLIHAKGSTSVRTRLYQIAISGLFDEISIDFEVYGIIDNAIYTFQRNVNYEAFLVRKK
ncbi:hypothetical protein E2R66_27550 [Mucilaginibacter psychrotolerans]|uniref:Uncharacterized protein n=1 Tax=Mucilaginibacter psychrotolerans TaxID=1524096 RepID=A0A4Y8RXJ6_9SPHI|nr:hypothetical protein E2R66_27550 [Mucilaginibacter psychrotolerans]